MNGADTRSERLLNFSVNGFPVSSNSPTASNNNTVVERCFYPTSPSRAAKSTCSEDPPYINKKKSYKRKRKIKRKKQSYGWLFAFFCLVAFVFFVILGIAVYVHSSDTVKIYDYGYQNNPSYIPDKEEDYSPPAYSHNPYEKREAYIEEPKTEKESGALQHMSNKFHAFLEENSNRNENNYNYLEACTEGFNFDEVTQKCVRGMPDPYTGIDHTLQKTEVSPCDNFYEYACGAFESEKRGRDKDATFSYMYKRNRDIVQKIIQELVEKNMPNEHTVSAFYHSCIAHSESVYSKKSQLYVKISARIDELTKNMGDMTRLLGELQKYDLILPIELSFELDPLFGKHLIPLIQRGGVFDTYENLKTKQHYTTILNNVMLMDISNSVEEARDIAKQIVMIEQTLADYGARVNGERGKSRAESRSLIEYVVDKKQYELTDLKRDWYETMRPTLATRGFDLDAFFDAAKPEEVSSERWRSALKNRSLWCHTIAFVEKLPDILRSFPLSAWKVYFKHTVFFQLAPFGRSSVIMDERAHYTYHMSQDSRFVLPWLRPRKYTPALPVKYSSDIKNEEIECMRLTEAYLPALTDRYYLRNLAHKPESDTDDAKQITQNVLSTFLILLSDNRVMPYLNMEDREELLRKLRTAETQVGAPGESNKANPRNVISGPILDPENFAENVLAIRADHVHKDYMRFLEHVEKGTPVSSEELFDGLLSIANAYYIHQLNALTLNTGLLQPPMYSSNYEEYARYARLGVTAAHELSHSLDTVGAYFDSNGTVRKWMSYEAERNYKQRLRCFVDLYSGVTSKGTQHDGTHTLNENVADITGMHVAWRSAFPEAIADPQDKRNFMLAYAQMYCESLSVQEERAAVLNRAHSIGEFRVNNVIGQIGEFGELWQCSSEDRMTRVRKCSIL